MLHEGRMPQLSLILRDLGTTDLDNQTNLPFQFPLH